MMKAKFLFIFATTTHIFIYKYKNIVIALIRYHCEFWVGQKTTTITTKTKKIDESREKKKLFYNFECDSIFLFSANF